jgi:hypothetical protein
LLFRLGSNGKLSVGAIGAGVVKQADLADHVIEGGPEVVEYITQDHAKQQGRLLSDLEPLDPFPGIRIERTDRVVRFRLLVEEPIHLGVEFVELRFAPVELLNRARKSVVGCP